jgi:hypothetical protein
LAKKKSKKSKACKTCGQVTTGGMMPPQAGGLSSLLPAGGSERFLLGAAIGAAAAYILGDEAIRGRLMKAGLRLYAELAGGIEEMKEQMADSKAELAAEQSGCP